MKDILVTAEVKTPSGHVIRTSYTVPTDGRVGDTAQAVGNMLTHAAGYTMIALRRLLDSDHGMDLLVEKKEEEADVPAQRS